MYIYEYSNHMIENPAIYEWLLSAGSDAEAAYTLYEAGNFPQALYCLQQSVEKSNKALGLWANFLERKDFQKVSHNHERLHNLAMEQQGKVIGEFHDLNIDFIGIFSEMITGERVDKEEYVTEFAKLKNIRETAQLKNVLDLEYEELEKLLIDLESAPLELKLEMAAFDLTPWWTSMLRTMIVKASLEENQDTEPSIDENVIAYISSYTVSKMQTFYKIFPHFIQVYILGFFTEPFAYTRYPEEEKGFNPVTMFTATYPFVRLFPRFHKVAAENIRRLSLLAKLGTSISIPDFDEEAESSDEQND